jgi:hypothetical protein
MDSVLSGATTALKQLYTTIKDYKAATSEAEDLAARLQLLDRVLQQVPRDNELLRDVVERVSQTIDESYSSVVGRLQKKDEIWKKAKDFGRSSSDRQLFAQIASKIQMAVEDLSTPLNLHITHGQDDILRSIMGVHSAVEDMPANIERIVKQTVAKTFTDYVKEPVEEPRGQGLWEKHDEQQLERRSSCAII